MPVLSQRRSYVVSTASHDTPDSSGSLFTCGLFAHDTTAISGKGKISHHRICMVPVVLLTGGQLPTSGRTMHNTLLGPSADPLKV
jgi:hypothetical protein